MIQQFTTPIVKKLLIINTIVYIIYHWLNFSIIDQLGLRSFYSNHFLPYQFFTHLFIHLLNLPQSISGF